MKSLSRSLILVVGLAACSSGPAERPETVEFHQVLQHLSWENKRILGRTDPAICGFALAQDLSSKHETPRWEGDPTFREYVVEAKRRGFSADSCAALFGWKNAQTKLVRGKVGNVEIMLTKLKGLYDEGIITQRIYFEKRREILKAL